MSDNESNSNRGQWEGTCVYLLMLAMGLFFIYYAIGMLSEADGDVSDFPGGRSGAFYVAIVLIGGGAWFVWTSLRDLAGSGKNRGKRRRRRKMRKGIDRIMQNLSGRIAKH